MPALRFSVYELDELSGELTRQGRRVAIAPQPAKVLWLLASRPGEVVTRETLRDALWGRDTHVEFDRSLNFCIAAVRQALGDHARHPRFIETVPRRGYRFVADARLVGKSHHDAAQPAWRRWAWAAVIPVLMSQHPATAPVHTRAMADRAALAAFTQGQALWDEGVAGRRRSAEAFESAVRLDGRFAEAHFAVAATYLELAQARALPAQDALVRAKSALERALDLEEVSDSRVLLGTVRLVLDRNWQEARRDFMRAIDLAPSSAGPRMRYAEFLSASGDDDAALASAAYAEELSPACDEVFFRSAWLHYRARRYNTALARLAEAQRWGSPSDPSHADWLELVHYLTFLIRLGQRDWPEAQVEGAELMRLRGTPAARIADFSSRDPREAVVNYLARSLERSRAQAVRGETGVVPIARYAALSGATDEAMAWLERGIHERDLDVVFALRDPAFDSLRALPAFLRLETGIRDSPGSESPGAGSH